MDRRGTNTSSKRLVTTASSARQEATPSVLRLLEGLSRVGRRAQMAPTATWHSSCTPRSTRRKRCSRTLHHTTPHR